MILSPLSAEAVRVLRQEHRLLQQMFVAIDESEDSREQASAFESLQAEWTRHAQREKQIFYPAVRQAGIALHYVDQAEETLDAASAIIQDLEEMDARDSLFSDKLMECEDKIRQHIQDDEHELLGTILEG